MSHVLILAQHDGQSLDNSTYAAVSATTSMGNAVHVLVAGDNVGNIAQAAASIAGVDKVLHADAPHYGHALAEQIAPLVVGLADDYSHIISAATTTGKDIMPRIAALLDTQQISDIVEVISADTFKRPIYAGNALETVKSSDTTKVITIRPTSFDKAAAGGGAAEITTIDAAEASALTTFIGMDGSDSDRPDLASASIVVSGGRGVGSAENFAIIDALAAKLGAAVGASRAAVDAGYVPNDYQVGQTGKIVAPELYIATGISGAIQHLAGMKESKVIVAINKDENAPIFDVADYGLVADLFDAVPELTGKL